MVDTKKMTTQDTWTATKRPLCRLPAKATRIAHKAPGALGRPHPVRVCPVSPGGRWRNPWAGLTASLWAPRGKAVPAPGRSGSRCGARLKRPPPSRQLPPLANLHAHSRTIRQIAARTLNGTSAGRRRLTLASKVRRQCLAGSLDVLRRPGEEAVMVLHRQRLHLPRPQSAPQPTVGHGQHASGLPGSPCTGHAVSPVQTTVVATIVRRCQGVRMGQNMI